ncbi:MAG: T9SS type A sorting domain-containing protein [Chitinophagaceae bacterium]
MENNNSAFSVYPNPAHTNLYIKTPTSLEGTIKIFITDAQGKLIDSEEKTINANNNILNIDVSKLAKGSYFIQLKTNGNVQNINQLFIKN